MNIVIAIQKLEKQKQDIDAAIRVLRSFTETKTTASKLIKEIKSPRKQYVRKGKHWTQRPENKKKMLANLKAAKKAGNGKA